MRSEMGSARPRHPNDEARGSFHWGDLVGAGSLLPTADATRKGRHKVTGDTSGLMYDHGETLLFEAMLGSISRTGTDPYTHTAVLGSDLPSYTIQVGFGGVTDTLVKQVAGAMVDSWQLALVAGENATMGLTWVGTAATLATLADLPGTEPSSLLAYAYMDGTITVEGASPACVKRITIGGNNNLDSDSLCIGRTGISDPERNGFAEITGEIEFEIDTTDTTVFDDYVSGTQKTVVLTLTRGSNTVVITMEVMWQADPTPKVTGPDKLTVTTPYKVYVPSGGTDAGSFSIVATNGDATP